MDSLPGHFLRGLVDLLLGLARSICQPCGPAPLLELPDDQKQGGNNHESPETLSLEPRVFRYHNFLSKDECEYLIKLAKPHLKRSKSQDPVTGKSVVSSFRTSYDMRLKRGRDKVVRDIEKRIADYTSIPVEHGESLQVMRYQVGQKLDLHHDYFTNNEIFNKNGGHRMATVLMYLSDVEEGGATVFPKAKGCGKGGLSVKPKMGDALFFWNLKPDGTLDRLSLHGGSPVIKGDKWACTKWLRVREVKNNACCCW